MNEFLAKKVSEMTVLELMDFFNYYSIATKPTMDVKEFRIVTGRSARDVYKRMKFFPEDIIVGGYESCSKGRKILFHTENVIKWLKSQNN